MFHLYYDTRLDHLADRLAGLLARVDPAALLVPQTILVPQPGLQRWLVQRLAEKFGIAANLEFIAPAQLVWRLLRAAHPGLPAVSAFDREVMHWRILGELGKDGLSPFLPNPDAIAADPLRRFELAGHLAQLFERYQGYRRRLLAAWERGAEPDDPQARLWRQLADVTEPSRGRLLDDFLTRFTPGDAPPPPGMPRALFAFGTINVSPDVLRVLGVLGRHVEVHFFMPTPCREYWGDVPDRHDLKARLGEFGGSAFDEQPNPLLTSLGGVGRDFVAQLFAYDEVQPDFETGADDVDPARDTLLHRVQADVVTLQAPDADARLPEPEVGDHSLHVHVCHSPLREVQVLHDHLLAMLTRDPKLEPRDIAVMVSDIGRYAPCVEAVFGAPEWGDSRRIPWTVADRPVTETHALVALFMRLLDLPTSRLTAPEVLEVLAVPAVQRRCGLADGDLENLAGWAQAAGIRWGADAADRAAHGVPAFEEFSWRFGRRRLLLGYMSGPAADGKLLDDVAPLTDIEGADAAALGALFGVMRELHALREAMRAPRDAAAWLELFDRALDRLLAAPEGRDEERAIDAIRTALQALVQLTTVAAFDATLDWITMRAFLRGQLEGRAPQQRFLAGGVNVCGLVPLRNVPFKVICVLGLDADSFPRRDPADALDRVYGDRIGGKRQPGDRSVRDDDRYLFLETVMAASDALYLSYTGKDARSGKNLEPSVVLSELLDALCTGYFTDAKAAREQLVTQHPMQPFSRRLFVDDATHPEVFTYRHEWLTATQAGPPQEVPPFVASTWPEDASRTVDLAELRRFFRNPAAAFLRTQARLGLSADADATDEREPLVLDHLQQYSLGNALVELARRPDASMVAAEANMRAQGLLPPLQWGDAAFAATIQEVGPALDDWRQWRKQHTPVADEPFRLELGGGHVLEGVLDGLHDGGYAGWVDKASNGKGLLSWWIGALAVVARDIDAPCIAWGRDVKTAQWPLPRRACMPDADAARSLLRQLLEVFAQGRREPLPLPPRAAFACASVALSGNAERAVSAASTAWNGGYAGYAERDDRWFALAFRGRELFDGDGLQARFEDLVGEVYSPMCMALERGGAP